MHFSPILPFLLTLSMSLATAFPTPMEPNLEESTNPPPAPLFTKKKKKKKKKKDRAI
jgi:hypothetical protein